MKFSHYQQLVRMMFEPDGEGGTTVHYDGTDVRQMHPLVLAYIGDAVFTLFVRTRLLDYEQSHVQALNAFGAQIVSAVWQSRAYRGIESMLTEEEKAVFRRARNTKSQSPNIMRVRDLKPFSAGCSCRKRRNGCMTFRSRRFRGLRVR